MPKGEREFETGKDESWAALTMNTYSQLQKQQNDLDTVKLQAAQDAATTRHLANQYALATFGIFVDRAWNVNITDLLEARSASTQDAMLSVLAAKVAELILEAEPEK